MKNKSFSKYLNERDNSYIGLTKLKLNEATLQTALQGEKQAGKEKPDTAVSFAKQVDAFISGRWTGLSPVYVMEIMKFSADWKDEYDIAELDVELAAGEDPYANEFGRYLKFDRQQAGGGFKIEMKFPGKMQGFMMMTIKKMFPDVALKFGNGLLTGQVQDEQRAANVFNIARKLMSGVNPKDNPIQKIDGKAQLDPADVEEYGKCVTAQAGGGKMSKTKISGPAVKIAEYVARRLKETPDDIKAPADYAVNGIKLTLNTMKLTYPMVHLVDMFAGKPFAKSQDTYEIRKALDALQAGGFGVSYNMYVRNLMFDVGKLVSDKKIDAKAGIQRITDEIYACLPETIAEQSAKNSKIVIGKVNEPPQVNAASKPAVRRMKLFKDAEYYGAQIISNSKWIAAVNRTYDQAHCFGRNKPKVDENGNIIEKANLRDDEMEAAGMTLAEIKKYKDIRDGNGRYVKDGITIQTAYSQPDSQSQEATWCVASNHGANKSWNATDGGRNGAWTGSYFKCKVYGERMPLITYMDCTNGRLYCSNLRYDPNGYKANDGFDINNGWIQYDFNTECNGQGFENKGGDGGLQGKLKNDPLFRDVYERATDESFKAYTAYCGKNRGQKMQFAAISYPPKPFGEENKSAGDILKEFQMTKNGTVICKSNGDVVKAVQLASRRLVQAIKLDFTDASDLFRNGDVSNFTSIDCSRIERADGMFYDAKVPADLQLVSTAKCKSMSKMFYGAKGLKQIYGLDTQSTQTIESMFMDSETPRQRPFYIQALDLQNCKRCDKAFKGSAIEMVTLRNFHPATADEMFDGCFQLKTMPDLKTKYELSPRLFGVDRWIEIFDGCERLQENHAEFVKAIKELEEYHSSIMSLDKDERGFVILRNSGDFEQYMMKSDAYGYNIRLDPPEGDASEFFAQSKHKINIDTLDLAGVKNAESMFAESKISHIGKIINCDQLTNCRYMFQNTGIATPPNIELPHVRYVDGMFEGCSNLRNIKNGDKLKTIFGGTDVVLPKEIRKTEQVVSLIFGSDAQAITNRIDPVGTRFAEWLKPIIDNRETAEARAFAASHILNVEQSIQAGDLNIPAGIMIDSVHEYEEYVRLSTAKPDIVKKQNVIIFNPAGGDASSMFAEKTIDFGGAELVFQFVTNASGMFMHANVKGIGKISYTDNITSAALMFKDAVIDKFQDEMSFKELSDATSMFENTHVENGGITKLSIPKVETAPLMFKKSNALGRGDAVVDLEETFGENWFVHQNLDAHEMFHSFKRKIKFGADVFSFGGVNANAMFAETEIADSDGMQVWIDNGCQSTETMFAFTKSLKQISEIQITSNECNCTAMFTDSEIVSVGDIATQSKSLDRLFRNCKGLEWVGDFQIPADCSAKDMFTGTQLDPVYGKDAEFLRAALSI